MKPPYLFKLVEQACREIPAVESVDWSPITAEFEGERAIRIFVSDVIPGQEEEPWVLLAREVSGYRHPFLRHAYDCLEFSLHLAAVDPDDEEYGIQVASYALPCLDSQSFAFGPSVHWDHDSGHFFIYGQVRLLDQSDSTLELQVHDMVRAIITLTYLIGFKLWQLHAAGLPEQEEIGRLEHELHGRMLSLLGATPDGDPKS